MIETRLIQEDVNGQTIYKTFCDLSLLRKDPQNPKDTTEGKQRDLEYFLGEYGQLMPLLVDARAEKEGQLIGGNHTLDALLSLHHTEGWIEFRLPKDDAEAFTLATLHNQQFSHYMEEKLKEQVKQYEGQIEKVIKKLDAQIKAATPLDELLMEKAIRPVKFEIVVKCENEADLVDKMQKLTELGISGKAKGK